MNQQEIRETIKKLKMNYGVTYAFIAKESHISRNTITLFAKGQRVLALDAQKRVELVLKTYMKNN